MALTLFTIPKPFEGHLAVIQENALESWRQLHPDCQILLFGDETGAARAAGAYRAVHIPEVTRNEFGTPLLHKAFAEARRIAAHPLLCYVNADIILTKGFLDATGRIRFKEFLMTGRKWNLDIRGPLHFSVGWEIALSKRAREEGSLGSVDALDYFLFPTNGGIKDLPPFAVGRPVWDNWLIFRARQLKMPVIDATQTAMVIHQNHGYNHVPRQIGDHWEGPEADMNRQLIGDLHRTFTLRDATHIMKGIYVTRNLSYSHLRRRWQTIGVLSPHLLPYVTIVSRLLNLLRRLFSLASSKG